MKKEIAALTEHAAFRKLLQRFPERFRASIEQREPPQGGAVVSPVEGIERAVMAVQASRREAEP